MTIGSIFLFIFLSFVPLISGQQHNVGTINFGLANPVALSVHMTKTCTYHPLDFKAMTDGVERILRFYESQTRDIVLDAAVGTRMLEGNVLCLITLCC